MKIALALEYNGAAFHGLQMQASVATVQGAVQTALSQVADEPITLFAAGRTDAGVHAALLPAHFQTTRKRQPSAWVKGGNALLPPAVKILWAKPVAESFHARHSAQRRSYQYLLLNRAAPPGLLAQHAGYCPAPLSAAAMRHAARYLRGERDFSAFRAASCQAKSARRQLYHLRIKKKDDLFVFDFCGNGFLHHMLRNIIGALLEVGRGRRPPQWTAQLLASRNRALAPPTAAAAGLYFTGADYPPRYKLPPCHRPAPFNA